MITGASSGLGKRFALTLSKVGANVTLVARRKNLLEEVAAELSPHGTKITTICGDVSKEKDVEMIFKEYEQHFGILDILINNAGFFCKTPVISESFAEWNKILDTNLKHVWMCTSYATRLMIKKNTAGSIINISSINGLNEIGSLEEKSVYSVAKAGVVRLTLNLVKELAAHNIRINTIVPGVFDTDMARDILKDKETLLKQIPLHRIGDPSDLDATILYLASNNASSYLTGSIIKVDGGRTVF